MLAGSVQPATTNTRVAITRDAIVIPETGRFEVPIVPVNLPATITNRADRMNEITIPIIAINMFPDTITAPMKPITIPPNSINL